MPPAPAFLRRRPQQVHTTLKLFSSLSAGGAPKKNRLVCLSLIHGTGEACHRHASGYQEICHNINYRKNTFISPPFHRQIVNDALQLLGQVLPVYVYHYIKWPSPRTPMYYIICWPLLNSSISAIQPI